MTWTVLKIIMLSRRSLTGKSVYSLTPSIRTSKQAKLNYSGKNIRECLPFGLGNDWDKACWRCQCSVPWSQFCYTGLFAFVKTLLKKHLRFVHLYVCFLLKEKKLWAKYWILLIHVPKYLGRNVLMSEIYFELHQKIRWIDG